MQNLVQGVEQTRAALDGRHEPTATATEPSEGPNVVPLFPKEAFNIERHTDPNVHPTIIAGREAFFRVEGHRKLFRADWLPFIDAVFELSMVAWRRAGSPLTIDDKPNWAVDSVQATFRDVARGEPWHDYFTKRRQVLWALRKIGHDRDGFLEWYDNLPVEKREVNGHPLTLWNKYAKLHENDESVDDREEDSGREGRAKEEADRIDALIASHDRKDVLLREIVDLLSALHRSMVTGSRMLPPELRVVDVVKLRDELVALLKVT
jgi:hypothetical protein